MHPNLPIDVRLDDGTRWEFDSLDSAAMTIEWLDAGDESVEVRDAKNAPVALQIFKLQVEFVDVIRLPLIFDFGDSVRAFSAFEEFSETFSQSWFERGSRCIGFDGDGRLVSPYGPVVERKPGWLRKTTEIRFPVGLERDPGHVEELRELLETNLGTLRRRANLSHQQISQLEAVRHSAG